LDSLDANLNASIIFEAKQREIKSSLALKLQLQKAVKTTIQGVQTQMQISSSVESSSEVQSPDNEHSSQKTSTTRRMESGQSGQTSSQQRVNKKSIF
jgi:hypothetical protein